MKIQNNSKFINNIIERVKLPLSEYKKMMKKRGYDTDFEWELRAIIADEVKKLIKQNHD